MSANNVVWLMGYKGYWHVFYSGCMDNTPEEPDYKDKYYKLFNTKGEALLYAHGVVEKIDEFSLQEGHVGVEYGVCIVPKLGIVKPWINSGLATILEYDEGLFRIRRYGWEAILSRNDIECMKQSIGKIYAISLKEGKTVEWKKMKSMVDHLEIENTIERILPTLDALYISSKTVTNKDIQDFVKLVEEMVNRLGERLTTVEHNHDIRLERLENPRKRAKRNDGCYQFTYCSECLAYPMGMGCSNLTKGPVQLKKPCPKPHIVCSDCGLWGECDHQGAYKTNDGKWCYE